MRTLLIDNHDSYTYNLFQLLAMISGAEPLVLTNDAAELRDLDLARFDNIVISPGPGQPKRRRDIRYAADVVASAEVPLLGVCLGHEAIAASAGAPVVPAPRARHGHLTRVSHDGRDLFRDIPQDFIAVRYHSLCVCEPLPPALEATAWAEDGVNMGIRHRDRPLWGVQFHPESVATRHGRDIVANFFDLTREYNATRPRPSVRLTATNRAGRRAKTAKKDGQPPRAGGITRYRLSVRSLPSAVNTELAFTRLFAGSLQAFWLDSARVQAGMAGFSYLGDASGARSELVTYRVEEGVVNVRSGDGTQRQHQGSVFDYLQRELRTRVIEGPELPFDFCGGYVGYFGYELKADCGSTNRHHSGTPDAAWLFVDRMVVVDHNEDRTYVLGLADGSAADAEVTAWLDSVAAALSAPAMPQAVQPMVTPGPDYTALELWLSRPRRQYLEDVKACQRKLLAGESYEICLTNSLRMPAVGDGYGFYRRLRRQNPAPYAAYLRCDGVEVACSSPERFLKIDRDRTVEAKPIKGTAPRGRTTQEDQRLREELATDPKNRAENLMIVDLLRNDLGRVCEIGSVHVPQLMTVESYATVHQLVSTIRGRLRKGADAVDCVRASFPGGSMTGAPKLRTMEIIDSLEDRARGIYSGALGFLSCNGCADLNIVIRTAVLADGEWHVGAGGAIVLDSNPEEEYGEMLLKADACGRSHYSPGSLIR
jgi:para-aminobenzoate synthetase